MEGGLRIAMSASSNVQSAIFESKENQISPRHAHQGMHGMLECE